MNLVETLQNIKGKDKLNGNTVLSVKRKDGSKAKGKYVSCIAAEDNDPEIAQLDIRDTKTAELIGILETDIQDITTE